MELFDADDKMVAKFDGVKGQFRIDNAKFWWPYTMSDTPAYLYKMKVRMSNKLFNLNCTQRNIALYFSRHPCNAMCNKDQGIGIQTVDFY